MLIIFIYNEIKVFDEWFVFLKRFNKWNESLGNSIQIIKSDLCDTMFIININFCKVPVQRTAVGFQLLAILVPQ